MDSSPRLPSNYLHLPITPQATDYSCGAAAMLSVAYYWNAYGGDESSLYAMLETTPKDGTHPKKLESGAIALGMDATLKTGLTTDDLSEALKAGDTVILDIQAWPDKGPPPDWKQDWDDGHYVVLIGMDDQWIYVMDPSTVTGYGYIPIPEFIDRWHDYETRTGTREDFVHAGVLIHGKSGTTPVTYPQLTRVQ